jgi:hypothetical protein
MIWCRGGLWSPAKQVFWGRDVLDLQIPHWLMIGGALLVLFGLVGTVFQRKRAASDPSRSEQGELTDGQAVSLPKFLE